jgi:NAD(P)H-nitrite reductase large subunit
METESVEPKGAILQRDQKTYAIIPRTPAGLVTPEFLEKVAAAAREFNIPVMKIVSGQRIALVGIEKDEVNKVWEFLGTDVGDAVGLCFHYVQACPGTTLCTYGTQDSVGLALELEEKYYGFEFPAKMKFGVFGCPLCCAESYMRDIGIVGKRSGWALSLGGNAGSNPRIGDVVAEKLTKDELINLIEKFVTYYVDNANKKERTSKFIKRVGLDVVKENMGL